jgi:hypothetical protein
VKDRLIQTRVPERLENVLKEEAQKQRLTVSHLIRNMLEDTLQLVDTVVAGAGGIVGESVDLAETVVRDAGKLASTAREAVRVRKEEAAAAATASVPATGEPKGAASAAGSPPSGAAVPVTVTAPSPAPAPAPAPVDPTVRAARLAALDHVLAWNQVVVNRPARCAGCDCELPRGSTAHLGLSQDPTKPPSWLCGECLQSL